MLRGWVYVLSNRAMPGIVKIGFSTKDPVLRADELYGTSSPHPFVVEYDVLVIEPRDVERITHKKLDEHHEGKEFFRVGISTAISAIRNVIKAQGKEKLLENILNSEIEPVSSERNIQSTPSVVVHGSYSMSAMPVARPSIQQVRDRGWDVTYSGGQWVISKDGISKSDKDVEGLLAFINNWDYIVRSAR